MISTALLLALSAGLDEIALKAALQKAEAAVPVNFRQVDQAVLDYAQFLQRQGRYREAEPLYLRSTMLNKTMHGPESPEHGLSLLRMGALYHAELHFRLAEELTRQSVDLLRSVAGEESLAYAYAIANLATTLAAQGQNARAEPVLRRAIYLMEKHGGGSGVAALEVNLGLVYLRQGEFLNASRVLHGVLDRSADCASGWAAMAELSIAEEHWVEAEEQIRQAYHLTIEQSGAGLLGIVHMRALVEAHMGDWSSALADMRRAIALTESVAGPDSPALLPFLEEYATILRRSRLRREALAVLRRARTIRELAAQP